MSRFIETIRWKDGQCGNLDFHQLRMNETTHEFYGTKSSIDLNEFLKTCPIPTEGLYKIKLVYDQVVQSVLVSSYAIKKINRLKMVQSDSIFYPYKFEDRSELNRLFEQRENCEDIIIVNNDHLTDASYANVAFYRDGKWFTPTSCLLNGTMRRQLIERKIIFEEEITIRDLSRYEKVKLINAMLQFDGPEINVSQIVG